MSDSLYKPNFGWMQPDKTYQLTESRLRFEVDASLPQRPDVILFNIAVDLYKGISNVGRFWDWHLVEYVPRKKDFGGKQPCCAQMKQRAGTPLKIVLEPSAFQGDTDDAHNFGELSDPGKRMYVDNKVDWIARLHFWKPTVTINLDKEKEETQAVYSAGEFIKWQERPDVWPELRKRFEQHGSQ